MKQPPLDLLGRKRNDDPPVPMFEQKRVTVIEDHGFKLPELWLNVFVHGPEAGSQFNKLFARAKCYQAKTPDDADLVVFTGNGFDIDPQIYGAKAHKSTNINPSIDEANLKLYYFCVSRGIPMFGVCGGAQLIHVARGGKLYQDVDGHTGPHSMWDVRQKEFIQSISSVHHQMCMKHPDMEVIGTSHKSTERWVSDTMVDRGQNHDIEAFLYRDICAFGVQGHPEYSGYNGYTNWCLKQLDKHFNENHDLCYRSNDTGTNRLRLKEDFMEAKAQKNALTIIPSEEMIIVEKVKG